MTIIFYWKDKLKVCHMNNLNFKRHGLIVSKKGANM